MLHLSAKGFLYKRVVVEERGSWTCYWLSSLTGGTGRWPHHRCVSLWKHTPGMQPALMGFTQEENPLLTNPRGAKCNHFLSHRLDMKWSVLNLAQMLLVFLNPAQNTNCWLILLCHNNTKPTITSSSLFLKYIFSWSFFLCFCPEINRKQAETKPAANPAVACRCYLRCTERRTVKWAVHQH